MTPYGATWTHMGPHGSSLFYRFDVGSECGLRSNCLRKTGLPCFYDLSYERAGSPDFIDFSKISKKGKGLKIVSAVSTPPFFSFENGKSPRISSLFFYRFYVLWSADRGRIVCAKPTAPVFMISHMDWLEAQISSIFRRFQRKERCFNCLRSIDSPAFLLWKLQKKGL